MLVACAHGWFWFQHSELGVRGAGRGLVGSMVQPGCQGVCVRGTWGLCVCRRREGEACRALPDRSRAGLAGRGMWLRWPPGPPWGKCWSPRQGAAVVNRDGCFSVMFYQSLFKLHFETVVFLCL